MSYICTFQCFGTFGLQNSFSHDQVVYCIRLLLCSHLSIPCVVNLTQIYHANVFCVSLDQEALCWIYVWKPRSREAYLWCKRDWNCAPRWMPSCSKGDIYLLNFLC